MTYDGQCSINLWRGAGIGLLAGTAGAYAMDLFQAFLGGLSSGGGSRRENSGRQQASSEPATVKAADVIAGKILGRPLEQSEKEPAGQVMHYAMGAVTGAMYGVITDALPQAGIGAGLPLGAAVWAIADEGAVPALKLSKPICESPASSHVSALLSHTKRAPEIWSSTWATITTLPFCGARCCNRRIDLERTNNCKL